MTLLPNPKACVLSLCGMVLSYIEFLHIYRGICSRCIICLNFSDRSLELTSDLNSAAWRITKLTTCSIHLCVTKPREH